MSDAPTKFEIYVEQLFKATGKKVNRNVIYIRGKRKTQIDLVVLGLLRDSFYELKYSGRGFYDNTYNKNPVDQVLRAADVSGLKPKGIITNGRFSNGIIKYADKKGIRLYGAEYLSALEDRRLSLDGHGWLTFNFGSLKKKARRIRKKIDRIDPAKYDLSPTTVYV